MRESERGGDLEKSVPAGEFSQINGQPPVMGEVVELDLAKEGTRDRRGSESPRVWVTTEFETSKKQAEPFRRCGAGDERELLERVRG